MSRIENLKVRLRESDDTVGFRESAALCVTYTIGGRKYDETYWLTDVSPLIGSSGINTICEALGERLEESNPIEFDFK